MVGGGLNFLFNIFNGFVITYPDMPSVRLVGHVRVCMHVQVHATCQPVLHDGGCTWDAMNVHGQEGRVQGVCARVGKGCTELCT